MGSAARQVAVVETSYGRLRGARLDGVDVFKGIPFAKPPVGVLRWRAPEAPAPWPGIRDAVEFGSCAIQSTIPGDVGELIGIATGDVSEDCLYLNVWTPSPGDATRPVMVWIHGGGNTVGAGSQPRVNGEHLARTGDVVVVTVNYRLGA
ncbi:MAG: carboxylesterase family protein, partial [Acidobacteria bacterium]|nr:carboxylesterase family protein [Acidobacteriota bacterium]